MIDKDEINSSNMRRRALDSAIDYLLNKILAAARTGNVSVDEVIAEVLVNDIRPRLEERHFKTSVTSLSNDLCSIKIEW